jgi:Family of unknown function (DUF6152)
MRRLLVAALYAFALVTQPIQAHHSMAAFDMKERITLQGVLTEFDWRNPHISLSIQVKNAQGNVETWVVHGPAPSFFRERSIERSEVADSVGKMVTVEASRARDGTMSALIRQVTLADGKTVSACPQYC